MKPIELTPQAKAYVEAAGQAAFGILKARQARDAIPALKLAREQAIWDLYHDSGVNHLELEERIVKSLRAKGVSDDEIWGLGVSHDAILRIAGTRRKPKPRPS